MLKKCGNGSEDQIIVLVPSTQQTPVFVDRIEGMHMFELASCVQKKRFSIITGVRVKEN